MSRLRWRRITGGQQVDNGQTVNGNGQLINGDQRVTGNSRAGSINSDTAVTSDTVGCNTAGVGTVNAGRVNTGSTYMIGGTFVCPGGVISSDPPGGGSGNVRSFYHIGGTFDGVIINRSDMRLKRRFRSPREEDLDALLAAPLYEWEWEHFDDQTGQPAPDDRRHVSIMAQHAPGIAQTPATDQTQALGIDTTTYQGLLLGLIQRQDRQITALREQLAALAAHVAATT